MRQELSDYLKAGFPIIAINTIEIQRSLDELMDFINEHQQSLHKTNAPTRVKEKGYEIHHWTPSSGWDGQVSRGSIMSFPKNINPENPAMFIMQNFHYKWSDPSSKLDNIQGVLDFHKDCTTIPYRHLFIIGNIGISIPPELRPLIAMIDMDLPTIEELKPLIDKRQISSRVVKKAGGEALESLAEAARGMTIAEADRAVRISIVKQEGQKIDRDYIMDAKARAVKQSGLIDYVPYNDSFDEDVGGLDNLKADMMKKAKVFHDLPKAQKYGLKLARGALFAGIPGTGKSLCARAIASLFRIPLLNWDIGRMMGHLVGQTEENTRYVFRLIRSAAPCVVRLDEIEKSLTGAERGNDSGVGNRIMQALLIELQEGTAPVFYVATANDVEVLPAALLRRFELWFVDLPSDVEREQIFSIHLKKVGRDPKKFKVKELAKLTNGFIGSEIEGVVRQAMYNSYYEDREVTFKDISEAINVTPKLSKTKEEDLTKLRRWSIGRARIANLSDSNHPAWYADGDGMILDKKEEEVIT